MDLISSSAKVECAMIQNNVYYLPGMGGRLVQGLGKGLLDRGLTVQGRELHGEFKALSFQEKVDFVEQDLRSAFWFDNARVVVNSFGAYLFLHAQAQMEPYPGKVLILSPIVGEGISKEKRVGFIPPRASKLLKMATDRSYPVPLEAEIHVGSEDWQSNPENVAAFALPLGIKLKVVPGQGHMLGVEYVGNLLDEWLK